MYSETVTVVIPASKSAVFHYMADLSNLPEWATEFCQELKVEQGNYTVITPMGEMLIDVEADEDTGVIDFYASPDGQRGFPFATRALPLPDGKTAFMAALFHEPGIPDEQYQQQLGSVRKELDVLQSLFSEA